MLSQEEFSCKISEVLGEKLPEGEVQNCLKTAQFLEPPAAKLFWQSTEAPKGLYIILEGKIRLLDYFENLITTLSVGASFGEVTLFEKQEFIPYAVRASHSLKLCFLKQETLQSLMDKYPKIRQKLLQKADIWDLIMLCRQKSQFPQYSSQIIGLIQALSLFEKHTLKVSAKITEPKDCQLWLLHRGNILDSDGNAFIPGRIYEYKKQDNLQVQQPSIAYFLKKADLQAALQHCPELAEFSAINRDSAFTEKEKPRARKVKPQRIDSNSKIIPFPGAEDRTNKNKKKTRPYFPSPKVKMGHWWGQLTKRYPYYAQQSSSDCGAACLVMIGRYWGKYYSVSRLRDITNAGRSGASLRALASAGESVGFATRPVKATLDKFAEQPLPAIAHWEGNHFIVVYRITKTHVIVGDPARGLRNLTHKEFTAGWTGYALLLQATSLLKDTENQDVG